MNSEISKKELIHTFYVNTLTVAGKWLNANFSCCLLVSLANHEDGETANLALYRGNKLHLPAAAKFSD